MRRAISLFSASALVLLSLASEIHAQSDKSPSTSAKNEPSVASNEKILMDAVAAGDLQATRTALVKASANTKNAAGYDALAVAAHRGHREIVAALLAAGAKVNATNERLGATALHWAAQRDDVEMVAMLHVVVDVRRGAEKVAAALLAAGADATVKNQDGKTPVHLAKERKRDSLVKLLTDEKPTDP